MANAAHLNLICISQRVHTCIHRIETFKIISDTSALPQLSSHSPFHHPQGQRWVPSNKNIQNFKLIILSSGLSRSVTPEQLVFFENCEYHQTLRLWVDNHLILGGSTWPLKWDLFTKFPRCPAIFVTWGCYKIQHIWWHAGAQHLFFRLLEYQRANGLSPMSPPPQKKK